MSDIEERLEQQLFRVLTKGGLEKEKEIESKGRYIHRPMKSIVHEELQAILALIDEAKLEAANHVKEICPITEGASVERLHHRIDTYISQLTKSETLQ